jgi:hypothetical protein
LTEQRQKVKNALNEGRTLVLGAEVLIGFEFRTAFQPKFDQLSLAIRYSRLTGLCFMLVALALLIAPATYHRIVEKGNDSTGLLDYITRIIEIALLPFALGLGIDLYLAAERITGSKSGLLAGAMTTAFALFCWYGWGLIQHHHREEEGTVRIESTPAQGSVLPSTSLDDKVEHVLIETRVVLPGVQALLGFQLTIMLSETFDQLPAWSKYTHLSSLALIAISIVLLITPAAYHRIVERGENTEGFHSFASRILLAAVIPLALGISGDFFVVVHRMTQSVLFAIAAASTLLAVFYGLWFALPIYRRMRGKP